MMTQTVKNLPAMQETWVQSLGREDPLEEGMDTPVFLPGEFLAGYSYTTEHLTLFFTFSR